MCLHIIWDGVYTAMTVFELVVGVIPPVMIRQADLLRPHWPTLDNTDKYSFAGGSQLPDNNIDDRYSAAGQANKVTKKNTFQPLTMIFANHLLVPSKTMDFVDSMNVLCSPALNSKVSLDINSKVSLDIHAVYRCEIF